MNEDNPRDFIMGSSDAMASPPDASGGKVSKTEIPQISLWDLPVKEVFDSTNLLAELEKEREKFG